MSDRSLDAAYFAGIYARSEDPWGFATSPYERAKYDATLAALPAPHFRRALEIGCSIGVLTARLAQRCDEIVGIDIDPRALELARVRCASCSNVRFERRTFPHETVPGPFDLVLVSEVAYYWSATDFARARERIAASAPGGFVELVHYLPGVPDYARTGDAVHDEFARDARFERVGGMRAERYRLDVLRVR